LTQLGSIGLIGSSVKWSGFRRRLAEQGHSAEVIGRIRCPIGLPEITGKQPAVIAVSVAAALLQTMQQETAPAESSVSTVSLTTPTAETSSGVRT